MKRKDMQEAFLGTYVVLINYFDLRRIDQSRSNLMSNFTPKIVRISESGKFKGAVMYPELYLYYPTSTNEPQLKKFSLLNKRSAPIPKGLFAKLLRKYFEKNNEV